MAAAYAALLSLSHILHQILHPPLTHHFILPTEQIQSLQDQVCSIISFFETYSRICIKEIEDLENRIVGAVYKAEDVIESNVVRQILAKYDSHREVNSFSLLCRRIQLEIRNLLPIQKMLKKAILKVIKYFGSIQRELDEIKSRKAVENVRLNSTGASSSRSLPSGKNIMVGFDEHVNKIRRDLASDDPTLLIVPIVGMGGIGKTTLATNVYKDAYIIQRFDVRAWVSVSQEYMEREIVITLLRQINSVREVNELSVDELRTRLYQELYKRRYLIVLDDIWDICAWENLKRSLPNNSNGSRILVTTRLQQLATDFGSCEPYKISLLDEEKSWELIHEYVFGKEKCPYELEEIGRSIARECGGLPLALAVIGGLLAKSEKTRNFWEYINKNVTSAAKQAEDSHCIHILRLSFSELPIHLKPCFLYLAVFPKNIEIRKSRLIRLWVAEGFVKPTGGDSLEEVGEGYLEDLFDRNLVMISKRTNIRKVKSCSIHDLIRELCMEEAQKNKFLCIAKLENSNMSPAFDCERRLSIHAGIEKEKEKGVELRAGKFNRSFLNYSAWESRRRVAGRPNLLRVLDVVYSYSMDEIMWLINSRYITCGVPGEFHASSLISLPWNLQTLVLHRPISLPSEFWQMPQLRHLKMPEITMADPSDDQVDDENVVMLENLQTLSMVKDFTLSNNVLRRIPNLKKLGIDCETTEEIGSFCLSNLASLHKLESLVLKSRRTWENMAFPDSLKKLTLSCCQIPWGDMSVIGSLPNLEVLKLRTRAAEGKIWKPNEGEFCRLKLLLIDWCQLEIWEADDSNFPSLEHVQLIGVRMEEFPMGFAQIETLRTIDLRYCRKSLFLSANKMSEERENSGYEAIQIQSFPKEIPLLREDYVVGFDGEADTVIKYLTEESEELDVISIVGMPGLGKTTLAWRIYRDPRIQYDFPALIWIYVSQEYNIKEVFRNILKKFTQQDMSCLDENELARKVRLYLEKTKFLLFMDNVWTGEAWSHFEAALPMSNKFGKVLITSRDEKVAWKASKRDPYKLGFLVPKESWELLQLEVFAKLGECPRDLEVLGKDIAKQCGGVPLAIVVIGGILVKDLSSSDVKNAWEKVSMHIQNDVQKLTENIILLSYNKLPHNLRNCFLYLGMFPEDTEISAWKLTRLWIAEGFIQQTLDKSLEEVAEEYLEELIERNLVRVDKTNAKGGVKTCRVHDMIHVFCKTQAAFAKQNLFQEVKRTAEGTFYPPLSDIPKSTRLCIHSNVVDFLRKKPKGPFVRSFLCFSREPIIFQPDCIPLIPDAFSLLRVLDSSPIKFTKFPSKITQLIHLRYIALSGDQFNGLPEAVSKLSNLQTIRIDTLLRTFEIKADLRKMMQLRHLKTKAAIIISKGTKAGENLQTLSRLSAHCCCEEVFNKAPNLKNLGIRGHLSKLLHAESLAGLDRLQKLKLVYDVFPEVTSQHPLRGLPSPEKFPPNLKILKLSCTFLDWEHMATLGLLPSLEVLKLKENAFMGKFWNVVGSSFPSLEVLHIARTDLEFWTATEQPSPPFPKLRCLVLKNCERLQEIPSLLEESLQILDIERVTKSIVQFARDMEERKQQIPSQQRGKRGGFKLRIAHGDGR